MRRTDGLFQLIKALNRADKRNFKLLTQLTGGDKKYLKLFDLIDRQSEYDEGKLQTLYEAGQPGGQISVAKHYLYNSILKSLAYFYKGDAPESSGMALQVRILVERSLLGQAQKLLRKAKAEATANERYPDLLELLELERTILAEAQGGRHYGEAMATLQEEEFELRRELDAFLQCQYVHDRALSLIASGLHARTEENLAGFIKILALLPVDGPHRSKRATVFYYSVLYHFAAYAQDVPSMKTLADSLLGEFEKAPGLRQASPPQYAMALGCHAQALHASNQWETASESLALLRALTGMPKALNSGLANYYLLALDFAAYAGDTAKGMELVKEMGQRIAHAGEELLAHNLPNLYFTAARMCLVAGRPKEALRWINLFLSESHMDSNTGLQCYGRLLNLMIHFDLGNLDLLEHNLKSAYNFIFKRLRMYKPERLVLRTVKMLGQAEDAEQVAAHLRRARLEIAALRQNSFDRPPLDALMFGTWVESKLGGESMAAVRRRGEKDVLPNFG